MTPLKKCPSCGDEFITNQTEVTCLLTKQITMLVVIDDNPIDDDMSPNPCRAGIHNIDETRYEYRRPGGKMESGCRECRRAMNRRAALKYNTRKRAERKAALQAACEAAHNQPTVVV